MSSQKVQSNWDRVLIQESLVMSIRKLSPHFLIKNPVIFVTALGAALSLLATLENFTFFNLQISSWLWFTVLFANFSESLAEGRGKAQANSLKRTGQNLKAKLFDQVTKLKTSMDASTLKKGDIIFCETGETIPQDGEVIEGVASVDESAITGESAPVIRESGGDRSAVTGGTTVKSDWLVIKVTAEKGSGFVDKIIQMIEGAKRQKTPNEIALSLVLSGLSIILLCVVFSLYFLGAYSGRESNSQVHTSLPVLISLFVCLIPTTIGGLLSAIGISGINRLIKNNVIAKSGRAVEAAGDISVLLLDKTGTITYGNRRAHQLIPNEGVAEAELVRAAYFSSMADETAEGRSIVELCKKTSYLSDLSTSLPNQDALNFVPFSAETRMSGLDINFGNGLVRSIRKGAVDAVAKKIDPTGSGQGQFIQGQSNSIAQQGGTPLLVSDDGRVMGLIYLKDIVKEGIKEKFAELRKMGIKTIMITGDNPLTAASIAAEAGVDDFIAEATPEQKLKKIREEQDKGNLVAMTGDGTNDSPALAQADVGVAMNSGTQAAREAGNMVDLDSDPTKLITVVEVGKQLLITRGALTTFSFSNDVAKYFAILPAIFGSLYAQGGLPGPLSQLNVMNLESPESSILSAVIFNALIIIALTPLAIQGVKFSTMPTEKLLQKNLFIYGIGGLSVPFIGIKAIDLLVNFLGLV